MIHISSNSGSNENLKWMRLPKHILNLNYFGKLIPLGRYIIDSASPPIGFLNKAVLPGIRNIRRPYHRHSFQSKKRCFTRQRTLYMSQNRFLGRGVKAGNRKNLFERVLRRKSTARSSTSTSSSSSSQVSEPISELPGILELKKDDFQRTVMLENKDVVVEFYTPEV